MTINNSKWIKIMLFFVLGIYAFTLILPGYLSKVKSFSPEEVSFIGQGLLPDLLQYPSFLASDQHRIIAVDTPLHQIAIYSANLDRINTIGSFGQNDSEFDRPGRVIVRQNTIYVLDAGNHRVQLFDFRARFVRQFSVLPPLDTSLFPCDMAIVGDQMVILMNNSSQVHRFSLEGSYIDSVNPGIDENWSKTSLFADDSYVYLWGSGNNQLFIYNHAFEPVTKIDISSIEANDRLNSFEVTSDEQSVYVLAKNRGKIYLLDKSSFEAQVIELQSFIGEASSITVSNSRMTISSSVKGTLTQYNKEGRVQRQIQRSKDLAEYWIRPEKMIQQQHQIYVLDTGAQLIKVFSGDFLNPKIIFFHEVLPIHVQIDSFAVQGSHLYLLNSAENKIYHINENAELLNEIGPLLAEKVLLAQAKDIAADDKFIYIADSGKGRIVKTDSQGSIAVDLTSQVSAHGALMYPYALDVDEQMIVVMDTQQHALFWYDKEGTWLGRAGKQGNETGSFLGRVRPQLIAPGRLLLADTDNHRIQLFDVWTGSFREYGAYGSIARLPLPAAAKPQERYAMMGGRFFFPSSALITKEGILATDTYNGRVQILPFSCLGSTFIETIPSGFDFVFQNAQPIHQEKLFLWTEAPLITNGSLTTTNPGIMIDPDSFTSLPQWVTITFDREVMKSQAIKEDRIVLRIGGNNGRSIPVRIEWEDQQDYRIIAPLVVSLQADKSFRIPFSVEAINGFNENVSFSLRGTPSNAIPSIEPSFYRSGDDFDGNIIVNLNPNRKWEHTRYEIVLVSQSQRTQRTKQHVINVFLNHTEFSAPRRVLAELFSGIWCTQCIYYHYVFKQLNDEIGNVEANFIQYYVFSTMDHPQPRLAWDKSNERIRFYQHDQGMPSLYFDGVDSFKGVPYDDREAAVYNICKTRVENRKKDPASISIIAHSVHNPVTHSGHLKVHLKVLEDMQNVANPRLFAALVESNIHYKAVSGKDEHHLIFRDFIPLDPSKPEQMGIPLRDAGIGFTGKAGEEIFLEIPYTYLDFFASENLQWVVFVQDQSLKKVYQSYRLSLETVYLRKFEVRTTTETLYKTLSSSRIEHLFHVYNPTLYPMQLSAVFSTEFNVLEPIVFELAPFSEKTIPIKVDLPKDQPTGTEMSFRFAVTDVSRNDHFGINGKYQIIEDLDPDFDLKLIIPEEPRLLSGETLEIEVQVTPAPHYDDMVELSLEGDLELVAEHLFETATALPPFNTPLMIRFNQNAIKEKALFTVRASGGEVQHAVNFAVSLRKNPAFFPPELVIFEPEEMMLTNDPVLIIRGKTDAECSAFMNEIALDVSPDGAFETNYLLEEGLNVIHIHSVNSQGLSSDLTLQVTLDTQPPEIRWLNLPESTFLKELVLKGKTEPENHVFFFDEVVPIDSDGLFEIPLELNRGINYLEVMAMDLAKNETLYLLEIRQFMLIKLNIGKAIIEINGDPRPIPAPPYIKNNRTMVPLRAVSEAFGFMVEWIAANQEIVLSLEQTRIRFFIGKTEVIVNQERLTIDAAPEIVNSTTFVPIRVVSEILGARIEWNASDQSILIEY